MAGTGDIVGHESVIERLWSAMAHERLHHAYLFEGPKGLGKAMVALRLAMAVNCDGEGAPCGTCGPCVQIQAGQHPDVWVVSAEKSSATATISVAQIREVVRKVGYHRYSARRRMVIVDPAEAMTPTAANALLKTLEEPPAGTGFVLITHQSDALLSTILSRCQRIRFAPVNAQELTTWLSEKNVPEPDRVAVFSQGCPGLALNLNEGEWTARREVRDVFFEVWSGNSDALFDWSKALCVGGRPQWGPRVARLIEVLEELVVDMTRVASGGREDLLHNDRAEELKRWGDALWPMGLNRCRTAIEDARHDLARNVSARLVVEALVSRFQAEIKSAQVAK